MCIIFTTNYFSIFKVVHEDYSIYILKNIRHILTIDKIAFASFGVGSPFVVHILIIVLKMLMNPRIINSHKTVQKFSWIVCIKYQTIVKKHHFNIVFVLLWANTTSTWGIHLVDMPTVFATSSQTFLLWSAKMLYGFFPLVSSIITTVGHQLPFSSVMLFSNLF